MLNHKGRLGTGNISSKILDMSIPRFDKDETKNREVDEKIGDEIFKLYGLADEENALIKKHQARKSDRLPRIKILTPFDRNTNSK